MAIHAGMWRYVVTRGMAVVRLVRWSWFMVGRLGFMVGRLGFMVGRLGFMIGRLGFMIGGFGFMIGRLGFMIGGFWFMIGRFGFMIHWFGFMIHRFGCVISRFVDSKYVFQTSTMSRLRIPSDRIVIVDRGWRGQHHHWSSRLMRMMNRSHRMVKSLVMLHHVMFNDRKNSVTMNLMMLLMYGMMSAVVSDTVTDMMCGGGDGDVMVSGRHRGGAVWVEVGRRSAQGREEWQGGVRGHVVWWWEDLVLAQQGG
jgi:hypothetical protein